MTKLFGCGGYTIGAGRLVEHRDVRSDALILNQPGQVGRIAVSGISPEALRPQAEPVSTDHC